MLCDGHLYTIINDVLYEVDLFTFTELAQIPGILSTGYTRMCTFNRKIVVTNETQFFEFYKNRFIEITFRNEDGEPIRSEDTALYNFGNNMLLQVRREQVRCLYRVGENYNCSYISTFVGSRQLGNSGLIVYPSMVIDLTNFTIRDVVNDSRDMFF